MQKSQGKPFDFTQGKVKVYPEQRRRVFVAMSGGVDSSVAAALLVKSGDFDVVGAHMKCWGDSPKSSLGRSGASCSAEQDAEDARLVAEKLGIPFYVFNFEKEYREAVYDYMVREYAMGLTPNPDVMCNKEIKFGIFLKKALELGADYIATGHYVKKFQIPKSKFQTNPKAQIPNSKLFIARDTNKDQSYFLWTLTQEQLSHSLFPIGDYTKDEVRAMAREFGLLTHAKKDSQGLCFVGNIDFQEFMRDILPKHEGKILTTVGKEIGAHDGAEFFTIGQRHGIGVGGGIPYYVAEKDIQTNTVVVAEGPYDDSLFRNELYVRDVHWVSGQEPKLPFGCDVRIRYRQPLQKAKIVMSNESRVRGNNDSHTTHNSLRITFSESQKAVTPGQSTVFYKNGEMLGGGIIV